MIKYFMRKTIYKRFDKESQDMLLQLISKQQIIEILCCMFWVVVYLFLLIPIIIINVCENIEFSMTTKIAIMAYMTICFIGLLIFSKVFERAIFGFSRLLSERIYFLVCTSKGRVLCKKEFNTIKQANEKLYMYIATRMCRGYCYSICFEICKALKRGSIEFLAIKKVSPHNDEEDDGKDFTIHVIYVNNGWAFDTYSSRQYPIEKLHEIYKAKVYKTFSYEEISSKSYEEFKEEQEYELAKWSNNNDCSMFD